MARKSHRLLTAVKTKAAPARKLHLHHMTTAQKMKVSAARRGKHHARRGGNYRTAGAGPSLSGSVDTIPQGMTEISINNS